MKTSSAKAKGRRLQQLVASKILEAYPELEPGDCQSAIMGERGVDIKLSPKGRRLFPYSVETKAYKSFAVYNHFEQAVANTIAGTTPALVIKGDRKPPLVLLELDTFMRLTKNVELAEKPS
jgi:hypothetical protein